MMLSRITTLHLSEEQINHRSRRLFLVALFVVVFIAARVAVQPINDLDYQNTSEGVKLFLGGSNPYHTDYYMPPWSMFFLSPLAHQPVATWLALDVAILIVAILDIGKASGLLLLLHPAFIAQLASANQEWLLVGPGLWLLYRAPKGWSRGLGWLLLTCKPQTTFILLLIDGWDALRERDWKAIGLAAVVAVGSLVLYPQYFTRITQPHENAFEWSATVLPHYGLLGAILVTLIIITLRWKRRSDRKTLGLLLSPVWSPYMLEYSYLSVAFCVRSAGWLRTALYILGSIGLAYLFWREYHVAEQLGTLGMVLLAALLAPNYDKIPDSNETQSPLQVQVELGANR